jgi:peptidoglycan/xylan/chitin deacetylase (PgdA/CDA1 family)
MATLREQLGTPDAPLQRRLMTDDELRRMDASDCVEVGAHTRTHPKLTTLTAEAQIHELQGSRARLEQVLGRPVPVVSYPYGAHDDTTVSAARASGFELACTTKAAPVPASCPPLRLPRFQVENWDGFDFDIQMRRWLASAA